MKKAKFAADMKKVSGIIVAALTNEPLRIVRSEVGKPYNMLKKLNDRYDSKSAATRISKMTELVFLRYDNLSKDIGAHIDKMAAIIEQLAGMNTSIPDELSIALLIASIHVQEMAPIAAAIKTLPDDAATWEKVTARFIEEHHSLKIRQSTERALMGNKHCEICERDGHFTKECWLNPKNPQNRLPKGTKSKDGERKPTKKGDKSSDGKKKKSPKPKPTRAAVAKVNYCTPGKENRMMLDSGTTTHMIPDESELCNTVDCSVSISLGDDSSVRANTKGTKPVTWNGPDGTTDVHLSETLAARDLAMRLLSVPALTRKGMAVLFLPKKAMIIDLQDNNRVIGVAQKDGDELYYISTDGSDVATSFNSKVDKAMMAMVKQHIDDDNISSTSEHDDEVYDDEVDDYSNMPDLLEEDASSDSDSESETDSETSTLYEDSDAESHYCADMPALLEEDEFSDSDSEYSSADKSYDEDSSDDEQADDSSYDDEDYTGKGNLTPGICGFVKPTADDVTTWHRRLGHQGTTADLERMIKSGTLLHSKESKTGCDPCTKGKFKRFFRGSLTKLSQPGKIHVDLVGRIKPGSREGYEYFMTIIDEATRYAETIPLHKKSDASPALLKFMKRFERQTGIKLRGLHTDDVSEFFKARAEFEEMGVKVTTSTAYTPTSNGLVEHTQGVLLSHARSCLAESKLPLSYWSDALEHVTKGRNVVPHSTTGKTPYTALLGHDADYVKHMRPFGCRVLVQPVAKRLGKFATRIVEGVCLGHTDGGVYKVLTSKGIVNTKHTRFFETVFPAMSLINPSSTTPNKTTKLEVEGYFSDDVTVTPASQTLTHESTMQGGEYGTDEDEFAAQDLDVTTNNCGGHSDAQPSTQSDQPQQVQGNSHPSLDAATLEELTHYPAEPSTRRQSDQNSDSDESSDGSDDDNDPSWEPSANSALPEMISTVDEPSVKEALRSPEANHWKNAIAEEFKTLDKAGTWTDQGNAPKQFLPSGVVLRLKRDEEGLPAKFKARLVARGNFQKDSEYTEENKYAPVASFDLVRILVALAASLGWERHQVDIKGAFLHSMLPQDADIWIKLPRIEGIPSADGSVVRLVKSLYGLREAPRLWYKVLSARLLQMGFTRVTSSDCLFIMRKNGTLVIILVYVDDLGLFGDRKLISFVKKKLSKHCQVTDLGESKFFLGVLIEEHAETITLTQKPLVQRILELAKMTNCNPGKTPLPLSHVLYEARVEPTEAESEAMKGVPYKESLGSLLFLSTRTRPDISTAVSMLGKFAASPLPRHCNAMKHHCINFFEANQ